MSAYKIKIWKNSYLSPQLEEDRCVSAISDSKVTLFHQSIALSSHGKKFFVWHWPCVNQCNLTKQILASLYLKMYISNLVLLVEHGGKWWHFCFMGICWPKANKWGKSLILFVTVFSIGKQWLRLFALLNTGLSSQLYFEVLFKIDKHFAIKRFSREK